MRTGGLGTDGAASPPRSYRAWSLSDCRARLSPHTFFHGGFLYENTGRYDSGAVCRLDAETGKTVGKTVFTKLFLEGSTALNSVLHMRTLEGRHASGA